MNIVNKILLESKQVGILYHYTSYNNLQNILYSNCLICKNKIYLNEFDKEVSAISFTRSADFHKNDSIGKMWNEGFRLVIDGNKLSHKYKIQPYNYYGNVSGNEDNLINKEKFNLYEEIVLTNKIDNIKNYIIGIEILPNYFKDNIEINNKMLNLFTKNKVPYRIIN